MLEVKFAPRRANDKEDAGENSGMLLMQMIICFLFLDALFLLYLFFFWFRGVVILMLDMVFSVGTENKFSFQDSKVCEQGEK